MAALSTEKKLNDLHWPLVATTLLICTLGVWNLASATHNSGNALWTAQLYAMLAGFVLIGLTLLVDYRWLQTLAWPAYASVVALLVGVALVGKSSHGAKRWLQLGHIQIQPSEFLKLALILVLARWFSRDETGAREGHYRLTDLFWPFLVILIPVALVKQQPDLSTAVVSLFISMTMILFAKVRLRDLFMLAGSAAAIAFVVWQKFLKPFQKDRILTFINPEAYAKTQGYHAIQSQIAIGSGQLRGKGWGEGTQNQLRFLPEQHTDFIFSVWAEEHGFILSILVVLLYMFVALAALDIAANAREKFGSFLCVGVAGLFFWHAFINIGMVTGVLPVMGVPLPLFSYGGSSVIVDLLGIGLLLNVSLRRFMF